MVSAISKIIFIKVGKVTTTNLENSSRKVLESAIKKSCVQKATLTKTGFLEDTQADKLHHGGESKALFVLGENTFDKLNSNFGNIFDISKEAVFGENLILSNLDESDICVGDALSIGETKIQVTQPRQPCWKLSASANQKNMTKFIFENGLTGWYAKVLKEGQISTNDNVVLDSREFPSLSIEKLNKLILNPFYDENLTLEALNCTALAEPFKESLSKRYTLKDKDDQFDYHE